MPKKKLKPVKVTVPVLKEAYECQRCSGLFTAREPEIFCPSCDETLSKRRMAKAITDTTEEK
jgi:rubrerythrin